MVKEEANRLHGISEITWVQEEPKNAGGWIYVQPRIITALKGLQDYNITYAGRPTAAATATGNKTTHQHEQSMFLQEALKLK